MQTAAKLKEHYGFSADDEKRLADLRPAMEAAGEQVAEAFYGFILATPEITPLIEEQPDRVRRHKAALRQWFVQLFRGTYDEPYFHQLRRIGATHVRVGLPGHFVNAGMSLLRGLGCDVIAGRIPDAGEREAYVASYDKILDMNLDVITSSYREAELRKVFLSRRLDEALLRAAERFSFALKLILVLALMGISMGVVALFVRDVLALVHERTTHGVLGALGSLLVIWVMVELMENEIRQLRGGRFRIQVFLGVALVAFIREILVSSLEHESSPAVGWFILGAILVLGVVYWLISRAEVLRGGHDR